MSPATSGPREAPLDVQRARNARMAALRHPLRRKAFEGGIRAVESDPKVREELLATGSEWWPELAPLNKPERRKVLADVREFARAIVEQQKAS